MNIVARQSSDPPTRFATATVNYFLLAVWIVAATRVLYYAQSPWEVASGLGYLTVLVGIQVRYVSLAAATSRRLTSLAVLSSQLALVFLPMLQFPWWLGLPGLLAGSALLLLRPPAAIPFALATVVGVTWARAELGEGTFTAVYGALTTLMTGLAVYGLTKLAFLVGDVVTTREELARKRVTDERLSFAQNLQELLGNRLSDIAVRADSFVESLRAREYPASGELGDMLIVARNALVEVRSVSSGYRQLSLRGELSSARRLLEVADIAVSCDIRDEQLAEEQTSILALALREGATNVLRHSAATHCEISVRYVGGKVRLDIVNDGVDHAAAVTTPERGEGLTSLAQHVTDAAGTLRSGRAEEGRYRLTVTVPAAESAANSEARSTPMPALSGRLVTAVVAGVFACFAGVVLTNLMIGDFSPGEIALGSLFLVALVGLQVGYVVRPHVRARTARHVTVLVAQAALIFPPALVLGNWWAPSLVGFFVASLLILLRLRVAIPLAVAAFFTVGLVDAVVTADALGVAGKLADAAATGLVVYGLTQSARLLADLHAAKGELARLAVAEERLRFARDVHDLLGLGLSAITLKAEVASAVLAQRPDRAEEQLVEIAALARKSLGEMRTIITDYRELAVAEELESVRSALAAAEIDVIVDVDDTARVAERESVLALVTREGVTNVLRHSKATWCEITLRDLADRIELEIHNDGIAPKSILPDKGHDSGGSGGSGIGNLTHRVEEVGGRLSYGADADGNYRLFVRLPVPGPAAAGSVAL